MPPSRQELEKRLQQLEEENRALRENCEKLQHVQSSYEGAISKGNQRLLRSDLALMELEQIFSRYTDAMWVVREDGIVLRANDAMLAMLGKSTEEVIGKPCSKLLSYGLCEQSNCPLKHIHSKLARNLEVQFRPPSGEIRHYLLTTAPLITIDGTPGIVAQFKDFTSRKEAEDALEEANQTLKKMARIDGLTQIANRRSFDESIEREWQRMRREQKPLSLLLCDIDYFKKYNDHYGHQAGDECLKRVAKALGESILRPADLAARYGGEEFVLLLPDADSAGALEVGTRVIRTIENLALEHEKSEVSSSVTLSVGTATLQPFSQQQQPHELIALADAALYQAKEQGRNRIIQAPFSPQPTELESIQE